MISPPRIQCFVKQAKPVERHVAKLLYDKLSALPAKELQKVQERVNDAAPHYLWNLTRNGPETEHFLTRLNPDKQVSRANILEYLKLLSEGKVYPHTSLIPASWYSGDISRSMVNDLMRIVKGDARFDAPNFSRATIKDLIPRVPRARAVNKVKEILDNVPEDPALAALSKRYGVPVDDIKGVVRQVNAEPFGKLLFTPHIADPVPNLAFEMGKGNRHAGSIKSILDDIVDPWEAIPVRNMQAAAAAGSGAKAAERDFLLANKDFRIVDPRHYPKKFAENTATTRRGRYDGAFYETALPQAYTPDINRNTQRVFLTTSTKPSNGRTLTVDQLASRTSGKPLLFRGKPIDTNLTYNMEREVKGGASALNDKGVAGTGWWFSPNVRAASNYAGAEPGSGALTYLLPVPVGTNITRPRKTELSDKLSKYLRSKGY